MPSGRRIVVTVWATLPEEVLLGPLSNAKERTPLRRAALPILRELFRGSAYPAADVYSLGSQYEGTDVDIIRARILDAAADIALLSRFLRRVVEDLGSRGLPTGTDPVFTAAIAAFFTRSDRTDMDIIATARALGDVFAAARESDARDEVIDVTGLREAFDDPANLELFETWLDDSLEYTQSPALAAREEYERHIHVFLDAVGFEKRSPIIHEPHGREAWATAISVDAPDPGSAPLSATDPPARPVVFHPLRLGAMRPLPLDRSIFERLWSTAKSASGQPWRAELPRLRDLIEQEIAGVGRPFGLAYPTARAGLLAGMRTYRSTLPTAFLLSAADYRRHMSQLPASARFTTGAIRSFLGSLRTSPHEAWNALSPRAQDELLAIEILLVPPLWDALHNAQYRSGHLSDPQTVWGLIGGEMQSMVRTIRQRHKRGTGERPHVAASGATAAASDPPDETSTIERDERVRLTMEHYARSRSHDALKDLMNDLRAALSSADGTQRAQVRRNWDAAADEIRRGESTVTRRVDGREVSIGAEAAATWDDLLEYLDDHFRL
ncbi:hypothetical protein [Microbacterium sp. P5_E9]